MSDTRSSFIGREAIIASSSLPSLINDDDINNAQSLSELDFQDIYFDNNGHAMMKGLETNLFDKTPPLVGIPRGVQEEVAGIIEKTFRLATEGNTDRFFMVYRNVRYRVQKMVNVLDGDWFTIRKTMPPPRLGNIKGMSPQVRRALMLLCSPRTDDFRGGSGLILFVGETASGKTTTGLSLLQEALLLHGDVAVSCEDPVEIKMSGGYGPNSHGWFFQHETRGDYETAMQVAMRETPRYIYLGEIRGREEAEQAIAASMNGHVVISTMHSDSPINAINRLIYLSRDRDISRNNVASGISAVIHQDLLRSQGQKGKYVKQECLFFDDDPGPRGMIRSDIAHQLTNVIEKQRNLCFKNELPIFQKR